MKPNYAYYKIGDVARNLGVSSDLLRYYEKKGIVKPHKDEENDYRYYEAWDINFLIECLWYKQYDFGMKDIAKIISDSSYGELQQILSRKEDEIIKKINYQEMLLKCLHSKIEFMERGKKTLNQCEVGMSPEFIRIINRNNYRFTEEPTMLKIERAWSDYFPFINRSFEVAQDVLEHGGEDFSWGYAMFPYYEEALNVKVKPPIERIPARKCIHCLLKKSGKYGFSPATLSPMLVYAAEHNLKIAGAGFGMLLCSVKENGIITGYFDAWIPVE